MTRNQPTQPKNRTGCSKRPLSYPPNPAAPRLAFPLARPRIACYVPEDVTLVWRPERTRQYVSTTKADPPSQNRYGGKGTHAGLSTEALAKVGGLF